MTIKVLVDCLSEDQSTEMLYDAISLLLSGHLLEKKFYGIKLEDLYKERSTITDLLGNDKVNSIYNLYGDCLSTDLILKVSLQIFQLFSDP